MARIAQILVTTCALVACVPGAAADRRAPAGEARLAQAIAGRTAGKPVSCLGLREIRSSQIMEGTAIVYQANGGTLYVNRPRIGADALGRDDILVTRTFGTQLCSLDSIRLVDRGSRFEHGFVTLDTFIPYPRNPPTH